MKRRLVVRPEAQLDAEEAAFWYDSQQPDLGDQFIQELDELLTRVTVRTNSPSLGLEPGVD
jgi:hypothetical protein